MKKRKSPTEVIEATPNPKIEHSFVKYPGGEPADITNYQKSSGMKGAESNLAFWEAYNVGKKFTAIHTHPTELFLLDKAKVFMMGMQKRIAPWRITKIIRSHNEVNALPSDYDLRKFLEDDDMKTAGIAIRNSKTGEVLGYQIIRKTKKTPEVGDKNEKLEQSLKDYHKRVSTAIEGRKYQDATQAFDDFAKKYYLQHRLVPAKDYQSNEIGGMFVRKKNLERTLASIFLIAGFIFMAVPEFTTTGNVIASSSQSTLRNIPALLSVLLASIGGFLFFKLR